MEIVAKNYIDTPYLNFTPFIFHNLTANSKDSTANKN